MRLLRDRRGASARSALLAVAMEIRDWQAHSRGQRSASASSGTAESFSQNRVNRRAIQHGGLATAAARRVSQPASRTRSAPPRTGSRGGPHYRCDTGTSALWLAGFRRTFPIPGTAAGTLSDWRWFHPTTGEGTGARGSGGRRCKPRGARNTLAASLPGPVILNELKIRSGRPRRCS